ncbi:MAG: glycosyltransferase family 4 protein [Candidatus Kryptoniota bacterium]
MKPNLAVVRGHYFSHEEVKLYEQLTDEFNVTFFSGVKGTAGSIGNIRVVELLCLDSILDGIGLGNLFRKIEGLVNNLLGIDPELMFQLKKALRGFSIVHTIDYNYVVTYQLALLKKELNYKLVATHWENIPFARDSKPICRKMKYFIYNNVDVFFAMSERAKASLRLEGVPESKLQVTYSGVDTQRFRPDEKLRLKWRERFRLKPEDIVLLFVGRIRSSKGVFELIYATKKLIEDPSIPRERVKVVIAGKGPREQELDRKIRTLGLQDNVIRIGFIPHSEIHVVHNMADIFVLPSIPRKYWQEQLGLVLLEAMACGKPVVSTLSGSIPEIVGGAGILVQPNDHLSLYTGLKRLITDRSLIESLGHSSLKEVQRRFTFSCISNRMKAIYTQMLKKNFHDQP